MRSLRLEFAKLRRKHVLLTALVLIAAVLTWMCVSARQDGRGSASGWNSMFYAAPLMNSVFLSLLAAVVASRVADVDHEADAWKQLLCLQRTGALLAAKLVCTVLVMGFAIALELAGTIVIGRVMGFPDMPGSSAWGSLFASQLTASLCMVSIVGAIALRWENQFIAIGSGLALSLAGLFSSFLPTALARLVPSGYFTLLSTLRIDWAAGSSAPVFYDIAPPLTDYALVAVICLAACAFAYASFSRKEH